MGRPQRIKDADTITVCTAAARTKLQRSSDRRALLDFIISRGGVATMREINAHFGTDCRSRTGAMISSGWLKVTEAQ